ncbi:hypothetical protein RvY_12498-3 [Ramazzottius varieornatus]|uniref:Protein kinase domain-containing protein n=1 Tax=Ramazzottius varieornatus TaxID=947166 RepID=A0A1D1VM04_RAMVA|nr:hypothetical protein RvY_12498-3 [Ramazzottius varieornatus]
MWNTKTTSSTTNISWAVSHIGIRYARGVLGNPMWSIDQSALEHIVRYDICLGVNHPEVAQMVLDEFIDSPQTSPRAKSYWLRDFYLPVYNSYGNTTVLANYFSLLSTNFPTFVNNDGFRRYNNATITVTLGLYVHFWSGAANTSLQYMAAKAFGWTAQDSNDFRQAQKDFPRICYAGQYDDILLTQNRPLSVLLGISIPFVAVALTASAVACWWYRKKKRGQRIQAVSLRSLVSNSKECQYGRDTAFTDTDNAPNGGKDSDFVIGKDLKLFVVPRKRFKQSSVILGKGEFGTVYAATAWGLYGLVGKVPVAAKVLKSRFDDDDVEKRTLFKKEVHITIKAGKHLNLVNLLGIVLDEANGKYDHVRRSCA